MKHIKKRIFHLILSVMLLIVSSALPAFAAEEAAEPVPEETGNAGGRNVDIDMVVFPGEEYIGKTWPEIVTYLKAFYGDKVDIDKNCSIENKTLEDGTAYSEGIVTGIPSGEPDLTIDQYYYLPNGQMAACVYKYNIPEAIDMNLGMTNMINTYGGSIPLDASTLDSTLMEMVSDQMQISSGMTSWTKPAISAGSDSPVRPGFTSVAQTDADSRAMYIALITEAVSGDKETELKMSGLSGTEDLTPEEITIVNAYIDYIQSHVTQQVNDFITFLKAQR